MWNTVSSQPRRGLLNYVNSSSKSNISINICIFSVGLNKSSRIFNRLQSVNSVRFSLDVIDNQRLGKGYMVATLVSRRLYQF